MTESVSPLDDSLGLTVVSAEGGAAVLRLDPAVTAVAEAEGVEFLHGGALATCVDTASWYAVESVSPGGWVVSSLALDFLRLARPEPHVVTATCRKSGRSLAVVDVEIASDGEAGRTVALGRATLARSPSG